MITEKKIINYVIRRMKCFHVITRYCPYTFTPKTIEIITFYDGTDCYFKDYIELLFGPKIINSPRYDNICRELINHQFQIDCENFIAT